MRHREHGGFTSGEETFHACFPPRLDDCPVSGMTGNEAEMLISMSPFHLLLEIFAWRLLQ
jgi:hypothetical protein